MVKSVIAVGLVLGSFAAQGVSPERKVLGGNVVASERDPRVRVRLPREVQYVGADRWVLYGMADCELHAFVDVDAQKNVQRLYWVQFEGYLPTRPELKHTYDSPKHANLGGMDFYVDTWVRTKDAETQPGSDLEHILALIAAKGYRMPEGMMYVRLVHLLDEQKRKELMIIYGEDVARSGFSAAELQPGGKANDRWPRIAEGLLEKAENKVVVEQIKP